MTEYDQPWKVADLVCPVLIASSFFVLLDGGWKLSMWLITMAIGIVLVQILLENRAYYEGVDDES